MRENKGCLFEHVPPAVHISTLFAALWLELGAPERIEISRRKLVVACAEAVKIRPELISRMRDTLSKIVPDKAAQFEAMMSQPRFMQMAQDATLGQENYLTEDRALQAFDKLEKHLQAEAEKKIKDKGSKTKEKYSVELDKKEKLISKLENELNKSSERREAAVSKIVASRLSRLRLIAKISALGFLGIGIIGFFLSYYYAANYIWAAIGWLISVLFLIAAFFEYSYSVIFRLVARWGENRIRTSLRGLGYDEEEARLVLNVETGDFAFKTIPPDFELSVPERSR